MTSCDARIRPMPNDTEICCDRDDNGHTLHIGTLRDYAWPGSATTIDWDEGDRRTFHGDWPGPCPSAGCVLPAGHPRDHAF